MRIIVPAALLLLIWIVTENRLLLLVRRDDLSGGRSGSVRIVQISDLHRRQFGKGQRRIVKSTAAQRPDVIFVTGDLVTRIETDFTGKQQLLRELCRIAPVYMIYGNHEQSLPDEYEGEFLKAAAGTDTVLLRNSSRTLTVKGRELHIYGFEPDYRVYKHTGAKHPYKDLLTVTAEDITAAVGVCPEGECLLLAHNPMFAQAYAEWGADFTFCGHVHGGVVRLFGVGVLSPERRFFPRYTKGVYTVGGKKVCVSAGLGKLRLFDPPEINVYDI